MEYAGVRVGAKGIDKPSSMFTRLAIALEAGEGAKGHPVWG